MFRSPRSLLPACWLVLLLAAGCGSDTTGVQRQDTMHAHTNRLIHETSPYLLQHAHNPVDWHPWGEEAFAKARAEKKLVLVSIGYSSCHWCHVMERECFENDSLAALMNQHYVCIKVDREERPDVDQVYMSAVQLMTQRGGWPLNCFTLPDGRPVYGGTYFPPQQWAQVLRDLHATWTDDPARVEQYAARLHEGVRQNGLITPNEAPAPFDRRDLERMVQVMDSSFDNVDGGADRAPKFPMPNNYQFLLRYAWATGRPDLKAHVELTLRKMALGGIHDQVGGGFARYSVDGIWKVPHFEKMLYDNAQLISLYSQAYQATGEALYKEVVQRAIGFVERELMGPDGACYSALDADSEGEEGRFYVWTREELQRTLGSDMPFAEAYYNIGGAGAWEHGTNILLRTEEDEAFAARTARSLEDVRNTAARVNARLLEARNTRERPALDDKSLVSWNALMVTAWCDAYEVLGEQRWLANAQRTMQLLLTMCRRPDGGLWHSFKDGKASINGYLEDHAFVLEALLALYGVTFDEAYLRTAREIAEYAVAHHLDEATGMCWFTSDLDPPLIARQMEVHDNVIPASNSALCKALFTLGHLYGAERLIAISDRMQHNVVPEMTTHPSGHSNWAMALMMRTFPWYEVAITGPDALALRKAFGPHYIPNRMFLGTIQGSTLPLLAERTGHGITRIHVCENKTCRIPVNTVNEALAQMP
jgi:uncharacterized protein YyaL (SSP411 family)